MGESLAGSHRRPAVQPQHQDNNPACVRPMQGHTHTQGLQRFALRTSAEATNPLPETTL